MERVVGVLNLASAEMQPVAAPVASWEVTIPAECLNRSVEIPKGAMVTTDFENVSAVETAVLGGQLAEFEFNLVDHHARPLKATPVQAALALSVVMGQRGALYGAHGYRREPSTDLSILSPAPGCGSTAVAIMAAIHSVSPIGFNRIKQSMSCVARIAVIVVGLESMDQWRGWAFNSGRGSVRVIVGRQFQGYNPDNLVPTIAIMNHHSFVTYVQNAQLNFGLAFLCLDDVEKSLEDLSMDTWVRRQNMPTSHRTLFIVRDLSSLLDKNSSPLMRTSHGNFVRLKMMDGARAKKYGNNSRSSWVPTLRKVAGALVLPQVRNL